MRFFSVFSVICTIVVYFGFKEKEMNIIRWFYLSTFWKTPTTFLNRDKLGLYF